MSNQKDSGIVFEIEDLEEETVYLVGDEIKAYFKEKFKKDLEEEKEDGVVFEIIEE